jgi:hypothetical protein
VTCQIATLWQYIKKLKETGTVADMPRSGRLTVLAQDKVMNISDHIMRSAKKSVHKLSQPTCLSCKSTKKVLRKFLKFYTNKVTSVHELKEGCILVKTHRLQMMI